MAVTPGIVTTGRDMVCALRADILDDLPEDTGFADSNEALLEEAASAQDESNLLWKTPELYRFINAGIREVALRTRCIRDKTSDLTQLAVTANGTDWLPLDQRIMEILRASWEGERIPGQFKEHLDEDCASWESEVGEVMAYVLDYSAWEIRPYRAPSNAGTLALEVVREPITVMTAANPLAQPEIPLHMRYGVLNFAAHLAYGKNDADTKDPGLSTYYLQLFEDEFGPRQARADLEWEKRNMGRVQGRARFEAF